MDKKWNEDGTVNKKILMESSIGSEYLNPVPHENFKVSKSNGDISMLTGQNTHYGFKYPTKLQLMLLHEELYIKQKEMMLKSHERHINDENHRAGRSVIHSLGYQYTNIRQVDYVSIN